jgi:hypothetical protein
VRWEGPSAEADGTFETRPTIVAALATRASAPDREQPVKLLEEAQQIAAIALGERPEEVGQRRTLFVRQALARRHPVFLIEDA